MYCRLGFRLPPDNLHVVALVQGSRIVQERGGGARRWCMHVQWCAAVVFARAVVFGRGQSLDIVAQISW